MDMKEDTAWKTQIIFYSFHLSGELENGSDIASLQNFLYTILWDEKLIPLNFRYHRSNKALSTLSFM